MGRAWRPANQRRRGFHYDTKVHVTKFGIQRREDAELSSRRNIVVIAHEAHRSHYGLIDGLARNLRDALPRIEDEVDEATKPAANQITSNLHQSRPLETPRDVCCRNYLTGNYVLVFLKKTQVATD